MRGVPQQSVHSTSSTLAVFSAATLQVALFSTPLFQALAVCALFGIKRFATPTCLRVGDELSLNLLKLTYICIHYLGVCVGGGDDLHN